MALALGFYKSHPTEYVLVYRDGQVRRAGAGLSFFYWAPTTSIVSIPISTADVPFILNEMTGNFQAVTVQGQLTYRVADPRALAGVLNFAVDPRTRAFVSTDPEKLAQRIVNAVQAQLRGELSRRALDEALRSAAAIAAAVLAGVRADPTLAAMGVECLSLFITAIKPTPEMAKALEAEYREGLQQRADQAIYARRAAAVEQERRIKENELNTQLLLEQRRQELVDLEGQNNNRQAEYNARSNDIWLQPWRQTDPRVLLALGFKLLGENAGRIGTLTVTPDLLASILDQRG
ncbi:MAG: SPFH domain-containing protein [Anaerolineales bacterium]|nr:SPFH domain-containing protein [Anaerolineales bacterium]